MDRIIVDKKIMHGKPVVKGTRVPVEIVVGSLAGGIWSLPDDLWTIVMSLITRPPASDILNAELAVAPKAPPLPELTPA